MAEDNFRYGRLKKEADAREKRIAMARERKLSAKRKALDDAAEKARKALVQARIRAKLRTIPRDYKPRHLSGHMPPVPEPRVKLPKGKKSK